MKMRLVITGFEPGQKISAIKAIRNSSMLGLKESKDLVEGVLPAVLLEGKTQDELTQICGELAEGGVRYIIEEEVVITIEGSESNDPEYAEAVDKGIFGSQTPGLPEPTEAPSDDQPEQKLLMDCPEDPKNPHSGPVFTEFRFLAHLAELTGLYIENAKDDDPDWLAHLGSLEGGAVDFAHFVQALGGEASELCSHGKPRSERCGQYVSEGVYTYPTIDDLLKRLDGGIKIIRGMQNCNCRTGRSHARRDCLVFKGGK